MHGQGKSDRRMCGASAVWPSKGLLSTYMGESANKGIEALSSAHRALEQHSRLDIGHAYAREIVKRSRH